MDRPEVPLERDIVLLLEACTARLDAEVLAAVRGAVGRRVRHSDGYVFQHLLEGAMTASELARRLGVTQQAASKQVADMEDRGLVARRDNPIDRRARLVAMTRRGRGAVEAGRAARASIAEDITTLLGSRRTDSLIAALRQISSATGAAEDIKRRRLRPESVR